jgi:hypothetical protein
MDIAQTSSDAHLTSLICPTCGAPLGGDIIHRGVGRCGYCDAIAVLIGEELQRGVLLDRSEEYRLSGTAQIDEETRRSMLDSAIGPSLWPLFKRYGTIVTAPLLGWSLAALFELVRSGTTGVALQSTALLVALSIVAMMSLSRWMIAGVWSFLFSTVILFNLFTEAHQTVFEGFFSLTSESSLYTLGFGIGAFLFFVNYVGRSGRLKHEQSKLSWRPSVALMFVLGLCLGMHHHAKPTLKDATTHYSWPYTSAVIRLTHLLPQLDEARSLGAAPFEADPSPMWLEEEPTQSNTAFIPLFQIRHLPDERPPGSIPIIQSLLIRSPFVRGLEAVSALSDRWQRETEPWDDEQISDIKSPLSARWFVLYEYVEASKTQDESVLRYWLIERVPDLETIGSRRTDAPDPRTDDGLKFYGGWTRFNLIPRAYQELPITAVTEDGIDDIEEIRSVLFESLRALTGGTFEPRSN